MPQRAACRAVTASVAVAGTFRKPAFLHTGALLKEFENGPEWTEARYAQQGARHHVLHQQGTHYADHAQQQEHPPGARAEVILRFDNDGVKKADNAKGGQPYQRSGQAEFIHM